jgi:hypothetical protein
MAKPKKETKPNTPADNHYIKINGKKLEDYVIEKAEEMLSKRGDIDPLNLINSDVVDLNLLSVYDNNHNVINYNLEGAKRGNEYWEEKTDEYIKTLEEINSLDISSFNRDKLKDVIVKHNKTFIVEYIMGIKANALDLASESTRLGYASRLADTLTDLQLQEIQKVGIKEFLELDLSNKPTTLNYYIDIEILKQVQEKAKTEFNDLEEKYKNALKTINKTANELIHSLIGSEILVNLLDTQQKKVYEIYIENKDFYDKRHEKRNKIQQLTNEISQKLKEQNAYLNTPRYRALDVDNSDVLEQMQSQSKDIEKVKINTSLLGNKLFTNKELETGTPYKFSYKERNNNEDITTSITIYDSKSNIIKLSKTNRDINDAVGSLLDSGVRFITLKQLYNFINKGIISNEPVEQDKIDELIKDLYKMDRKAEIDATDQFKLKGYQPHLQAYEEKTGLKARPIISQNLINFKMLKNVPLANGELIDVIQFMDYPAVYDYARQYRQLAPYPAEILNLNYSPKGSNDDNTIQINDITRTIRNELIRCIELRKSGVNQPLVINNFLCNECQFYDVIDKDTIDKNKIHTKILNKQKRVRYTKSIETILNNFKDKGYIKNYTINKLGKVNKYSITFKF